MNAKEELVKLLNARNLTIIGGTIAYNTIGNNIECKFSDYENEEAFLNAISHIDYCDGYGIQELYGNIYCVDKATNEPVWLERAEYDGSEWWHAVRIPKIYRINGIVAINKQ
jgi:hypothetical protein